MATKELLFSLASDGPAGLPREAVFVGLGFVALALLAAYTSTQRSQNLPYINFDNKTEWTHTKAKHAYVKNAKNLISSGFKKFTGPFRIVTEIGPMVLLPPEYIEPVNKESSLSFQEFFMQLNLAQYETFKNFRVSPVGLLEEAIMKGLTRNLPKFTKALSDNMTQSLDRTWGDAKEWHIVNLRADVLSWVARLTSRIYNGPELSENEEWLRISVNYTVEAHHAVNQVKLYPAGPLRYLAERFLPICRRVRRDWQLARDIIQPVVAKRNAEIAAAEREGRKPNVPDDSIEWFRHAARGRKYDDVIHQIGLCMVSIHPMSDLLGQAVLNLAAHPEFLQPMREEVIEVLNKYGWKKIALNELRLIDSFFKETQRLKPIGMTSMRRLAMKDVELPNGIKLKKGDISAISSHRMWSEDYYEDPEVFDGYRFMKRRQTPGLENHSLLVSTSTDFMAFSHGKHACPGRFFAANEVKIAMAHLVLKYDIKLVDGEEAPKPIEHGFGMLTNPKAKIMVRRRKPEIDLDAFTDDP